MAESRLRRGRETEWFCFAGRAVPAGLLFLGCFLPVGPLSAEGPDSLSPVSVDVLEPLPSPPAPSHLVAAPLLDVRREPRPVADTAALKSPYDLDPFQETQVLFGEEVRVLEEQGAWARIEALEQPEFSHARKWEGYPGWVLRHFLHPKPADFKPTAVVCVRYARLYTEGPKKGPFLDIPLGARLAAEPPEGPWARVLRPDGKEGWVAEKDVARLADLPREEGALRQAILRAARLFLKDPYYWGGRCPHRQDVTDAPTGVDCSGLVNLSYRVNGLDVPRDAHEQYLKSRPVFLSDLKPADLIFLAPLDDPNRVAHVMLFVEGDRVLEAVHEFNVVRETTVKNKLGKPLKDIAPLEAVRDRYVYLGRLVPETEKPAELFPLQAPDSGQ